MNEQQRLLERLPDYLNGHVTGEDGRHIAVLLENDRTWQQQAAAMADLRQGVAHEMDTMDSAHGLAELRRRMAASAPAPRAPWWRRLLDMRAAPVLAFGTMASLAAVCVVQGWMLAHPAAPAVAWRAAPFTVAAPAANLRVRFHDGATLAQVEAVLAQAGARLVAGPGGRHAYLVQADDPAAALPLLRASAVVRDASPAAPVQP
ncbi:hypothetical protein [Massilia sp. S19_KUP03_FR1]|uniref:hypothetical protein n=1 Tax=Massilia sp. S19_KUP03_FR1 TaxID=3025503 RepID=UPI002FCDB968